MNKKVIVIGGGPAGMMAAGTAALNGCDVCLIEKNKILGKKLLITGKGRCNVTNFCDVDNVIKNINSSNPKFMYSALNAFSCYDTYAFFEEYGVSLKIERGNRVFPMSDRAVDVRDALKKYISDNGVKVLNENVTDIISDPLQVVTERQICNADAVILATGGLSYPLTGSTGDGYRFASRLMHKIIKTSPALVAIEGDEDICSQMSGLSLKNVAIKVTDDSGSIVYSDFGEMLFTHTGVSGPVILSASSKLDFSHNNYILHIDLKPALSHEELDKRVLKDFSKYSNKDFVNSLGDLLPNKLINVVINKTGVEPRIKVNSMTKFQRNLLVETIKDFKILLARKSGYEQAIITSGGVSTEDINPKTMESLLVKGLYFAGEIIDVDANTGGYNLQIAFSTGYLAGVSCSGGKNGL